MRNRSIGVVVLLGFVFAACGTQTVPVAPVASGPTAEPARPSNPGAPGAAISLTGDPKAGAVVFSTNCQTCHGDQGKGGVSGSLMLNVLPEPGSLSTVMRPRWACTMCWTIDSPRPLPLTSWTSPVLTR